MVRSCVPAYIEATPLNDEGAFMTMRGQKTKTIEITRNTSVNSRRRRCVFSCRRRCVFSCRRRCVFSFCEFTS